MRVLTLAFALLVLTSAGAPAAAAETSRLTVATRAVVTGATVRLGDLAVLEGEAQTLADVDLGPAPAPGTSRRLTGHTILRQLREAGLDPTVVRYAIPARVQVERAAQEVSIEELQDAVERGVSPTLGAGESLRAIEIGGPARIPVGPYTLRTATPSGRGVRRRTEVAVLQDGVVVATQPVRLEIEAFGPVVVARHAVPRGGVLQAADVTVEERDLGSAPASVLRDPAQAVGKQTRVALGAGAPVTAQALANPLLVRRGDRVTVVVETPAMRLAVPGEALEDGAFGAGIRVMNRASQKELAGQVVDHGMVLVQY